MADPMNPQGQSPGILGLLQKIPGTLESAASNPLVQGALAGYFGAISAPKHTSMAGRLGVGGLQGLQGYQTAEQLKSRLPLEQAQTQEALANSRFAQGKMNAINALPADQQGLAYLDPSGLVKGQQAAMANRATAGQLEGLIQSGNLTPEQKQRATVLEQTLLNDTSTVYDPKNVFESIYKEPLEEQKAQTDITKAQTDQKKTEGDIANQPLQRQELQTRIGQQQAEINRANVESRRGGAPASYAANGHEFIYDPTTGNYRDVGTTDTGTPKPPSSYAAGGRENIYDPKIGGYRDVGPAENTIPRQPPTYIADGRRMIFNPATNSYKDAGSAVTPQRGPASYEANGRRFIYAPFDPKADGNGYVDMGTAHPAPPKLTKVTSPLDLEKQADKEAEEAWTSHWHLNPYGVDHETFTKQFKTNWLAQHGAEASGAGNGLPPHASTGGKSAADSPPIEGAIRGSHAGVAGWFDPKTNHFYPD